MKCQGRILQTWHQILSFCENFLVSIHLLYPRLSVLLLPTLGTIEDWLPDNEVELMVNSHSFFVFSATPYILDGYMSCWLDPLPIDSPKGHAPIKFTRTHTSKEKY